MMENVIKYRFFFMPNDNSRVPNGKNKIILPAIRQKSNHSPQTGPPWRIQEKLHVNIKDSAIVINNDAAVTI